MLQIHDELLLEAPADEVEAAIDVVRAAMVGAYALDPPLEVDAGVGETVGGQGVRVPGDDDHHRTLQVHPEACPEVIDAAYAALREIVLRDESDDAPRRLAALMRAHRALILAARGVPPGPS